VIFWLVNGLLLVINNIPLKALAPYKAEDAQEAIPHFEHQLQITPIKFPKTKFNNGESYPFHLPIA
jgi:hypothetical protein